MTDAVIDVQNLTKIYGGRRVVDALALKVERGQIYGFLGPNGSGKTTTIRMVCGLLKPDEGKGTCLGFDVLKDSGRIKAHVGYMTQRFSLYEDLSIRENLSFIARMYGLNRREERVTAALEQLGLASRAGQVAGRLSGGWKQRLALAACMIHEPELLLLDEPTAGVDPKARRDFWDQIRAYAARGVTTLVSTHYMDEAIQCDRIAFIAYGRKLIDGATAQIPDRVGLKVWRLEGAGLAQAAEGLRKDKRVALVARFGDAVHACGLDEAALAAAVDEIIKPLGTKASPARAGLEEVFIYLMGQSQDNIA
jgi:ABC-2 type transport system ATP-binding protein